MAKLNIINTIRQLRFENNEMTQEALAKKVGCTRQTIAAIEKVHYFPSLELAFLIADALGNPFIKSLWLRETTHWKIRYERLD